MSKMTKGLQMNLISFLTMRPYTWVYVLVDVHIVAGGTRRLRSHSCPVAQVIAAEHSEQASNKTNATTYIVYVHVYINPHLAQDYHEYMKQ